MIASASDVNRASDPNQIAADAFRGNDDIVVLNVRGRPGILFEPEMERAEKSILLPIGAMQVGHFLSERFKGVTGTDWTKAGRRR